MMTRKKQQNKIKKSDRFILVDFLKNDAIRTLLIIALVVLLVLFFGRKVASFAELNVARYFNGRNDDYAITNYRYAILFNPKNTAAYNELSAIYASKEGYLSMAEDVLQAGNKEANSAKLQDKTNEISLMAEEKENKTKIPEVYLYGDNIKVSEDTLGATKMTITDNGEDYEVLYEYDENQRIVSAVKQDSEGNILSKKEIKQDSNSYYTSNYEKLYEVSYSYDDAGHLITEKCDSKIGDESISDKYGINYKVERGAEDSFELLDDMSFEMYSARNYTVNYTYDEAGLLSGIEIKSNRIPYSVSAEYDKNNRVKKVTITSLGVEEKEETRDYTYDGNGNCTKKVVSVTMQAKKTRETYTYSYTKENQLLKEDCLLESSLENSAWEKDYSYTIQSYFDENGNKIGDLAHKDGVFKESNRMEYDSDNRMIKHSHYVSLEDCFYELIDYDEKGNCIEKTTEYPYIYTTYVDTNKYDANGRLLSGLRQSRKNKTSDTTGSSSVPGNSYITYRYTNGKLSKKTYFMVEIFSPEMVEHIDLDTGFGEWFVTSDALGTENGRQYEEYDNNGNLLILANFDTDNNMISKIVYVYDESGRPISETCYQQNGERVYDYRFHYDENNRISVISKEPDGGQNILEYDETGHLLKETDSATGIEYTFLYNEDGKITEMKGKKNGKTIKFYRWKY